MLPNMPKMPQNLCYFMEKKLWQDHVLKYDRIQCVPKLHYV